MKVSVIIPTHRPDEAGLKKLVNQCLKQELEGHSLEVLIVLDRLQSVLTELAAPVQVLVSEKPGVNSARNCGAIHAQGEILVFLDDDCVPSSLSYLRNMAFALKAAPAPFVGMGGDYLDEEPSPWSTRGFNLMTRLWLRHGLDSDPFSISVGDAEHEAFSARHLAGGNMAFQSRVFGDLGFRFDESIVSGGDETDLHRRLGCAGHRLIFSPSPSFSVIHHAALRGESPVARAVGRAIRHGRASPRRRGPAKKMRSINFKEIAHALSSAPDPGALAFIGIHFASMFAARAFLR